MIYSDDFCSANNHDQQVVISVNQPTKHAVNQSLGLY